MKAQELRDRLAAVRSFSVLMDGKKVAEVVIDISNSKVHLLSEKGGAIPGRELGELEKRLLEKALINSVQNLNTGEKEQKKRLNFKDMEWGK